MPVSMPFRQSRLSWIRCAYCHVPTYSPISRTIFSRNNPRVIVEYRCKSCGRHSTLRHPQVMGVALPVALAAGAIYLAYGVLDVSAPWYSLSAILATLALMGLEVAASFMVPRVARRFDPS